MEGVDMWEIYWEAVATRRRVSSVAAATQQRSRQMGHVWEFAVVDVCAPSDCGAKANPVPDGFCTQNQNVCGVCHPGASASKKRSSVFCFVLFSFGGGDSLIAFHLQRNQSMFVRLPSAWLISCDSRNGKGTPRQTVIWSDIGNIDYKRDYVSTKWGQGRKTAPLPSTYAPKNKQKKNNKKKTKATPTDGTAMVQEINLGGSWCRFSLEWMWVR